MDGRDLCDLLQEAVTADPAHSQILHVQVHQPVGLYLELQNQYSRRFLGPWWMSACADQ